MAVMNNNRLGKCSNFGNCSIADARAMVEVAKGVDFVCTECGKPLLPIDSGERVGGAATRTVGALLIAALAVAAALWWFFLRGGTAPAEPPAAAPPPAVVRPDAPAPAAVPETGDCSEADQRAGVCTRAR